MPTLYELEISELDLQDKVEQLLEESLGDITEEIDKLLRKSLDASKDSKRKAEGYAKFIKNLQLAQAEIQARAQSFQDEADMYRKRAKATGARAEHLSTILIDYVCRHVPEPKKGPRKLVGEDLVIQVNKSGAKPVIIDSLENLPKRLCDGEIVFRGTIEEAMTAKEQLALRNIPQPDITVIPDKKAIADALKADDKDVKGTAHFGAQKLRLAIK